MFENAVNCSIYRLIKGVLPNSRNALVLLVLLAPCILWRVFTKRSPLVPLRLTVLRGPTARVACWPGSRRCFYIWIISHIGHSSTALHIRFCFMVQCRRWTSATDRSKRLIMVLLTGSPLQLIRSHQEQQAQVTSIHHLRYNRCNSLTLSPSEIQTGPGMAWDVLSELAPALFFGFFVCSMWHRTVQRQLGKAPPPWSVQLGLLPFLRRVMSSQTLSPTQRST